MSVVDEKKRIASYWEARQDECGLPFDWDVGHKVCWGCGYERNTELCHIVPDSLGGQATPDNIVLLCRSCHNQAPDSTNPKYMWVWIRGQGSQGRLRKEVHRLLRDEFAKEWASAWSRLDTSVIGEQVSPYYIETLIDNMNLTATHGIKATNIAVNVIECVFKLGEKHPKCSSSSSAVSQSSSSISWTPLPVPTDTAIKTGDNANHRLNNASCTIPS